MLSIFPIIAHQKFNALSSQSDDTVLSGSPFSLSYDFPAQFRIKLKIKSFAGDRATTNHPQSTAPNILNFCSRLKKIQSTHTTAKAKVNEFECLITATVRRKEQLFSFIDYFPRSHNFAKLKFHNNIRLEPEHENTPVSVNRFLGDSQKNGNQFYQR